MKILLETTSWTDGDDQCNHVYVMNDSMTQAVAYVPRGTKVLHRFKNPLKLDTRGRTFVELGDPAPPSADVKVVEGSRGERYYLTEEDGVWSCTCPGFKFRGSCKHVAEMPQ